MGVECDRSSVYYRLFANWSFRNAETQTSSVSHQLDAERHAEQRSKVSEVYKTDARLPTSGRR